MKKLLSMILVLAMLCTMFVLASCEDKTDETSSTEATSSEESVAPPTNAELLEDAFGSLESYMDAFTNVFAIDDTIANSTSGKANITLSLDELSAMGQSAFGDDPFKIVVSGDIADDAYKALAVLHAGGDEVKMDLYQKGDKQYVMFPELYENTVFDYADFTETVTDPEAGSDESDVTLSPALLDELKALLLKEENITISEDGKTYTVTLGKEDVEKLGDILGSITSSTEGMDDIIDMNPDGSEDPVETPEPDSAVFVLTIASETQASCTLNTYAGETVVDTMTINASVLNTLTTITLDYTAYDGSETDLTATANADSVTVEGKINLGGTLIEIDLDATKANDTCTFDGTISLVADMSGMLLTIPFEIDGSVGTQDNKLSMALSLSASLEGMMDIGISMEMDFTPSDVTVTLPFDESDIAEYDAEDFAVKMEEVYPGASALMGGSSGGDIDDLTGITYQNDNTTLTLYSDNTAEIIDNTLTYEKTDKVIKFFKNGEEVYTLSYEMQGELYVIYGENYETMTGTPENDGFAVNFYYYYDNNTYLDVYLLDDTHAGVSMCYAFDPEVTDLLMTLPSGDTLTYDIEMSDDGMSLTLWGETLTIVTNEF